MMPMKSDHLMIEPVCDTVNSHVQKPEKAKTYPCVPEPNITTALVDVSIFGERAIFISPRQECCRRGGHDAMKRRRIARVPDSSDEVNEEGTSQSTMPIPSAGKTARPDRMRKRRSDW
jgi:hypothetical protein